MDITISIAEAQIWDLLVTAFEGGISYWGSIEDYEVAPPGTFTPREGKVCKYADYPLSSVGTVIIRDHKTPENNFLKLNRAAIERGLKVMVEKYPWHFGTFLRGNGDVETADVFIQCCAFGEIRYG